MDKLMDNAWFIKILALLLAILLYFSIPNSGSESREVNVPGENSTAVISDIPVKVYYDTENLVVSGIPDTVEVTIKGQQTLVQSVKALRNFEVFVNLTNAKIGKQKVNFEIRELSDRLDATIDPESANISIQEKVTKEFSVEAEFNTALLEEGYAAGDPTLDPKKVKITGAKDIVEKIMYVKAAIESKGGINQTFTQVAQIQVLDRELNKLSVDIEPETVKVTIPVKAQSKKVPIEIIKKGTPPTGITIESIKLDIDEATISGNDEILKEIENVLVEVDVSKITDNITLSLPVIIANGIKKVTPELVKATVNVTKQGEVTVSGIPLNIRGLSELYEAVVTDPGDQLIDLLVTGQSAKIAGLTPDDFMIFIDLSGLTEGNHDVNIHVEGPSDVNWKPDKSSAKITLKEDNQ
ncbi:CdaR family protein [Neobacillus sp. FSL H8-0543]|uniref:CdaR family protein n=1 Tax=Neobacillus sp. FSL H8-0543 TaxID=2954672 RepID=UPI0031581C99